jgi:hypothetical protein
MALNCKDINGNDVSQIVLNDDGTVSGVINVNAEAKDALTYNTDGNSTPTQNDILTPLSKKCCESLGFVFDVNTNTCRWSDDCETNPDFKIIFNPQGNDGAIFQVEENENCVLNVEFDYLFEFNCDSLVECKRTILEENTRLLGNIQIKIDNKQIEIDTLTIAIDDLTQQKDSIDEATDVILNDLTEEINAEQEKSATLLDEIDRLEKEQNITTTTEGTTQLKVKNEEYALSQNKIQELVTLFDATNTSSNQKALSTQSQCTLLQGQLDECNNILDQLLAEQSSLIDTINSNPSTILELIQGLDVCVTVEKVTTKPAVDDVLVESLLTVETVFEEELFKTNDIVNYISGNSQTGFYFNSGACETAIDCIIDELGIDCELVTEDTFNSNWLHHSLTISDLDTLSGITNEKIKLGFKIKNCECDFSILVDRIEMNKRCTIVDVEDIFVSQCPGFELERICDNKKSWVARDEFDNREFDLTLRETKYDADHHKLIINSKEVDLDVNLARAIETDVWCFSIDNPCLFSGCTGSTSAVTATTICDDIGELMSTPISGVTIAKEFGTLLCEELIDVKSRKTICGYPVLRQVYERYLNSEEYCGVSSSAFNYQTMESFASLVGNYWVDLIEQVMPATALWGSTYVYENTVFDRQKFSYKKYTLFTCDEPTIFPFSAIGSDTNVEVMITDVTGDISPTGPVCLTSSGTTDICQGVYNVQIQDGSEFIGTVNRIKTDHSDTGGAPINDDSGDIVIIHESDPTIIN